jgi:hypothetical protein
MIILDWFFGEIFCRQHAETVVRQVPDYGTELSGYSIVDQPAGNPSGYCSITRHDIGTADLNGRINPFYSEQNRIGLDTARRWQRPNTISGLEESKTACSCFLPRRLPK